LNSKSITRMLIVYQSSENTNQADSDQFTQAAQSGCPAAEVERTAPSFDIDHVTM
jgi:hypothetical protein